MAVSEPARHRTFKRFEEVVGTVPIETMMELLPPVGWADVATKHDLAQLEHRIDLRFEALEHKLASSIDRAMASQTRWFLATMVTFMLGVTGLVLGLG